MHRLLSLIVCAAALLLVTACERTYTTTPTEASIGVDLQLNWKPEPQVGGFYAADYMKYGLEVNVIPGGVGTPTVQMVAAGKVPFAVVSADEVVIARSNGADVVALFAVYQTNPQGLMTHAARGFDAIDDVFTNEGTVAMQRGLPYASFLEKKYGFDKVKVVPSPGGDLSALRADPNYTMQCFVTSEPLAAKKAGLDVTTFLVAEAGYNPYTTVLVTQGAFLASNRSLVESVVRAVREGWQAYVENPGPTNDAMRQLNPTMDAETFTASAAAQKPLIQTDETAKLGLGAMTAERWQTLVRQLKDLNVIQTAPPANECFVDPAELAPATQPAQ